MPGTFSQAELIQSVDILKVTVPRMNKFSIPLTPDNYAIWYEYSQGTTLSLNKEIDDHLNSGADFSREYNHQLYEKYIAKHAHDSVMDMQDATKSVIQNLVGKIQTLTDGTSHYGGALDECKAMLADDLDVSQLTVVVGKVLTETEGINSTNKTMMSNLAAMEQEVVSLRAQMEALSEEAHLDQLTRVANRRAFDKRLDQMYQQFHADKKCFSTILIDIDHFKKFNDTYGHAVGDKVLTYVASSLKDGVKEQDLVARYGGEEFVILLPATDYRQGIVMADKIRQKIAKRKLTSGKSNETIGNVTISAGVSTVVESDNASSLIERADKALYKAKNDGRNLVRGEQDLLS